MFSKIRPFLLLLLLPFCTLADKVEVISGTVGDEPILLNRIEMDGYTHISGTQGDKVVNLGVVRSGGRETVSGTVGDEPVHITRLRRHRAPEDAPGASPDDQR